MRPSTSERVPTDQRVPDEFTAFSEARQRPALYLFHDSRLDRHYLLEIARTIGQRQVADLDFVIHSPGGDVDAAYQIMEFLRQHAQRITACVPLQAKSAATLMCLGADEILMTEISELGPLDMPMPETDASGGYRHSSALNLFKCVEELQGFAVDLLGEAKAKISSLSDLTEESAIRLASGFVGCVTAPLFSQLDPESLGDYRRWLTLVIIYGDRLLRRRTDWSEEKRQQVLNHLVYDFPAHGYVLNATELKEIGLPVKLCNEREAHAARDLFDVALSDRDWIAFVEPPVNTGSSEAAEP